MATDRDIDVIYDYFDSCMRHGEFDVIDGILLSLCSSLPSMDLDIALTYLTASYPVKSKLPNRKVFFCKCLETINKEMLKNLE